MVRSRTPAVWALPNVHGYSAAVCPLAATTIHCLILDLYYTNIYQFHNCHPPHQLPYKFSILRPCWRFFYRGMLWSWATCSVFHTLATSDSLILRAIMSPQKEIVFVFFAFLYFVFHTQICICISISRSLGTSDSLILRQLSAANIICFFANNSALSHYFFSYFSIQPLSKSCFIQLCILVEIYSFHFILWPSNVYFNCSDFFF